MNSMVFVGGDGVHRSVLAEDGTGAREVDWPAALAWVPGLGLVVRGDCSRGLQVFATPDAVAMGAMSAVRVAWMGAVARGAVSRRGAT